MVHSYDYELLEFVTLGLCNGDYSPYRIGQAVRLLKILNATDAQVEEIRKKLEALALPSTTY